MIDTALIATVGDAIAALSAYDPTTPLRVATQPSSPMKHLLTRVVCTPDAAKHDGTPPTDPPVVWLGVGASIGRLPKPAADALGWSPTTTAPGLADRAMHTARAYHAADPDGFRRRHDTPEAWNRWARRARVARTIAAALQIPVDAVLVTDDPQRTYPARTGPVPGDLIIVTDPLTGSAWRFVPDHTAAGQAWLLLDRCLGCLAEVAVARVATLADLGDHLDPDRDTRPAREIRAPADHQFGCTAINTALAELYSARTTAARGAGQAEG